MRTTIYTACLTTLFALSSASMQAAEDGTASAAAPAPATASAEGGTAGQTGFSQAQLDQMMAPVALYPDSLLSQVLMAATYPDQVAQAVKWAKDNPDQKGDDAVTAVQDKGWDASVASLAAFPQVLDIMGEKPDWVRQVGDAFLADTDTVMSTIQGLRAKAKEAGNLETSEQQKVIVEQSIIKIEPADPQVVYVPAYNPTVIYGPWWWPMYPPFYYYPPGYGFAAGVWAGIGFGIGIGITNAIWGGFNWRRGDININVNKFNNINVNNRISGKKNNISWKNQNTKRRDKARKKAGNRQRPGAKPATKPSNKLGGADKRKEFRGRDADRAKAQSALKNKGIDPAKARKDLKGKGGDRVRGEVNKIDRSNKLGSGVRDKGGKLGSGSGLKDRKGSSNIGRRDYGGALSKGNSHAFEGLGSSHKSGLSSDRGRQSNRSFQNRGNSGGGNRSFGGGGRSGGGGGGFGGRGGGGGGHLGRR